MRERVPSGRARQVTARLSRDVEFVDFLLALVLVALSWLVCVRVLDWSAHHY